MQMQALIVSLLSLYSYSQTVMGGTAETAPLVQQTHGSLGHSTSYGGQSASSAEKNAEVDYGDEEDEEAAAGDYNQNPHVDTSWAAEPSKENSRPTVTFQDAQEEEEESSSSGESDDDDDDDDDDDSDSSSSSEEEDDDEEANNQKTNWQKAPPPVTEKTPLQKKKTNKRSKKVKARGGDGEGDESVLTKPRRNCCHSFFIVVQIAAVLANLCMITLEVVPAIYILKSGKPNALQILDLVLRSYFTFFSTLFLAAELELFNSSLSNWVTKGFLYSFLGEFTMDRAVEMHSLYSDFAV